MPTTRADPSTRDPMVEPPYAVELVAVVDRAARELSAVPDAAASRAPEAGKWSPKRIVGHLVDSAANNHRRFVAARWRDDLVFEGYDQERWVEAQAYDDAPWEELIALWRGYNRHLARLMASTPVDVRQREHRRHNLDAIAWRPVPAERPATLDQLMRDYVDHLKHHLRQIAALVPGVTAPPDESP